MEGVADLCKKRAGIKTLGVPTENDIRDDCFAPLGEPVKKANQLIYGNDRNRKVIADNLSAVQVFLAMKPEAKKFSCLKGKESDLNLVSAFDFLTELLQSDIAPNQEFLPQLSNTMSRNMWREFAWVPMRLPDYVGNSDKVLLTRNVEMTMRRRAPMDQTSNGFVQKSVTVGRFANPRLVQSPYAVCKDTGDDAGEIVDASVPMASTLAPDSRYD